MSAEIIQVGIYVLLLILIALVITAIENKRMK